MKFFEYHNAGVGRRVRRLLQVAAMATLALWAAAGLARETVSIDEWTVPWSDTRPRDPWVYEGQVWFVGQRGDYVGRFDPGDESFKKYPLESGAGPHTVIVDERGAWYAGNRAAHIGLVNPDTGEIRKYPLPGRGPRDVHTMDFTADGGIWFSVQGGNRIGFFDPASGDIELHSVPTGHARPYGLVVHDGAVWATLFGTHELATIEDGAVREIELPRQEARPRRLAVTGDGMVWYVDYAGGYIGRYNPADESVREWRTPGGEHARPYGMAADGRGRLWFVETGLNPNRLVGFLPETETFTEPVAIPSGGGTVRHMFYDPLENVIWFGADTNTVGRVRLPE